MKDSFDEIPASWFFNEVNHRFRFLTSKFRFSLESEDVDKEFYIPRVTYRAGDFVIIIGRGRGSIRIFAGIKKNTNRITTTMGHIFYILDIEEFDPDKFWDTPHKERLMNQLDWYANHIYHNLPRISKLFLGDGYDVEREQLYLEILGRRKKLMKLLKDPDTNKWSLEIHEDIKHLENLLREMGSNKTTNNRAT